METRLDSYFPYIGYLSQDPSVFDGTVRENLIYGLYEEITDEKLYPLIVIVFCSLLALIINLKYK